MKKNLLAGAICALAMIPAAAQTSDPVLMTVAGKPVHQSEFEYLYNKNNTQQVEKQNLDVYLQMFTDYKLKVADAEAAGLDKTSEFAGEFANFRRDLAAPYFRDADEAEAILKEAYNHHLTDVYVSHIMIPGTPGNDAVLDSIRTEILAGRVSFEDAAREHSIDRYSAPRGGLMGFVTPDRFPWAFEKASYDTPVGEISPVVNSGMGYHIIRVESRTPAIGEVNASHILRGTRDKSPEEVAAQKAKIDSIYSALLAGADFEALAQQFSEDPGSAARGGSLGFFPRGAMVAEFDSVAFALNDGELSAPFTTSFGYHIIKRLGHKDVPSFEDLRPAIEKAVMRDERANRPEEVAIEKLLAAHSAAVNQPGIAEACALVVGNLDSVAISAIAAIATPAATFDAGTVSFAQVAASLPANGKVTAEQAESVITAAVNDQLREAVLELARQDLEATTPEYRNLVNEYRDGILLYEIANRNVWDRAAKDTEGLRNYFNRNKSRYTWETPKFKSIIIFAASDSLVDEAIEFAETISSDDPAAFTQNMRTRFGRDVKVERVIAAKGENAITDYLGFGEPKPDTAATNKWKAYKAYKGRVIDAPEEPADVRGAAVTDYQTELEENWVEGLRKKYKVKVNKGVFKDLKKKYAD